MNAANGARALPGRRAALDAAGLLRSLATGGRPFAWGTLAQIFSSTTNFGLSVLAARMLGPVGLGIVTIGFSMYLMALAFERAVVSDPLIVLSSPMAPPMRAAATQRALTVVITLGVAVAALAVLLGGWLPGTMGRGLILFSPWILVALVQDFWRSVLCRDGRERAAAGSDAARAIGMALALPLAWSVRADWSVVACWGVGTACGAALGFVQTRVLPAPLGSTWTWWRRTAWPLGRWLAAHTAVYGVATQASVFLVAALLGSAALGGLRAAQTVFAPLTFLGPAMSLVGLPAMAKRLASEGRDAMALSMRLSAVLLGLTLLYVAVVGFQSRLVLSLVFGQPFSTYDPLLLPTGVAQALAASGFGSSMLLKAAGRGQALLWSELIGGISTVLLIVLLASTYGLLGAAWGMTAAWGIHTLSTMVFAGRVRIWRDSAAPSPSLS